MLAVYEMDLEPADPPAPETGGAAPPPPGRTSGDAASAIEGGGSPAAAGPEELAVVAPEAPPFYCDVCASPHGQKNVATIDCCTHQFCFRCIYQWATEGERNTCPYCRERIKFIFVEDQTFSIPGAHINLTVQADGGRRYVWEVYPMRGKTRMLTALSDYEEWLEEERGYAEEVQFYFRGVLLHGQHKLRDFSNVRDGETIDVIPKIRITFKYEGGRFDPFCWTSPFMWSNTKLTVFETAFRERFARHLGDGVEAFILEHSAFDFYNAGMKLSSLGDYVPPFDYLDGDVVFVKDQEM